MKMPNAKIVLLAIIVVFLASSARLSGQQMAVARDLVTQIVDGRNLVTLTGNVHPLARPEFDQGVAPDDLPMERMLLVLKRGADREASLRQLLDQQQVNSSTQFHQWLTPEQFGLQYGLTDSDLQAVTSWLSSQGFQVSKVAAGRTVIEFSGTAGLVRQVLGTEIHKFRVNGTDHWANISDPQIPAALAPAVAGIASLNNFPRKPLYVSPATALRSQAAAAKGMPFFTFPATCSNGDSGCYYISMGPGDFAKIYNVSPLWNASPSIDGTGISIAVVGETNINVQDVHDFRSMFGLPVNDPTVILNGPDPGILTNGEETEADLDVEWSGGIAKGATIDFVVSEGTETSAGIDLSALYIVDNNLAPIMSESYGACEQSLGTSGNAFYSAIWEQAAAEGITVLLGSGDSGSAGCDSANSGETAAQNGLGVSGFASTPFNVAVGGTDFHITNNNVATYWSQFNGTYQASALEYIPETTWNYSCANAGLLTGCTPPPNTSYLDAGVYLVAGGGGLSQVYAKPSWQSGSGVPNDGARDIPDVSLVASGYYVICEMDANLLSGGSPGSCDLNAPYRDFQIEGGTSASVQAFAGVMAMVNQAHGRQGNANYVFYPLAAGANTCASNVLASSNTACIFYDTQVGNNSVICKGGSPNCSSTSPGQYGIIVSNSAAAYATTSGFDLATGLGSVNVANLVNHWKSNFTPDTITLSLTPNAPATLTTLVHGQPVNYAIKVSTSSGTPTGDASLIAKTGSYSNGNGGNGIGPFTLNGGSASGSTIMLPGGSYNVAAHYAGNGTFQANDSSPGIPVVVSPESSKTELHLVTLSTSVPPAYNVTSVPYGSPYFLRMDVTNSSGLLCAPAASSGEQFAFAYPCPTGSLMVTPAPTEQSAPANTVPGHYSLNSQGYAEDQPIQQPVGVYNFAASYSGDISYAASASPTLPITVTTAPTSTTLTASPTSTVGGYITLTVVVNTQSVGAAAQGTVQLLNNGTALGSPLALNAGTPYSPSTGAYATGSGVFVLTLPPGADNLSAQYSGDSNYAGSTSAPVLVSVTDFSVLINPSSINISAPGQSGTAAISLTPLGGFTGTVNLSCSPAFGGTFCSISPASVNLSGSAPVATTLTITTTAKSSFTAPRMPDGVPPSLRLRFGWPAWFFVTLALLVLAGIGAAAGRNSRRWQFAGGLVAMWLFVACGSGGGGNTAPPPPSPEATFSPTNIVYGQWNPGSTSPAQVVTFANIGSAPLSVSSVAIGGANPGDFTETNNCANSVAVGSSCKISATFTPAAVGARSASLMVTDNAVGSPHTINLSGAGVLLPIAVASPTSLTFGQVNVGYSSTPQTVTIANVGGAALSIPSISFTGSDWNDYQQTNNCGGVAPGANCAINVVFTPLSFGTPSTASMMVNATAPANVPAISITGSPLPNVTPPGSYIVWIYAQSGNDSKSVSVPFVVQ